MFELPRDEPSVWPRPAENRIVAQARSIVNRRDHAQELHTCVALAPALLSARGHMPPPRARSASSALTGMILGSGAPGGFRHPPPRPEERRRRVSKDVPRRRRAASADCVWVDAADCSGSATCHPPAPTLSASSLPSRWKSSLFRCAMAVAANKTLGEPAILRILSADRNPSSPPARAATGEAYEARERGPDNNLRREIGEEKFFV
jgi:hypothetical protein